MPRYGPNTGFGYGPQVGYGGDRGESRGRGGSPIPRGGAIPSQSPGDLGNLGEVGVGGQFEGTTPRKAIDAQVAGKKPTDDILALLQQFYDEFHAPLDFNDPIVANILANAKASTMQSAGNAGVFGPYSQNLAQQAYVKSAAGLQDSRNQLAQRALGMLTDYKVNKRNFDYQKAEDAYTAAQDKWKYDQGHNADLWKGVAGGLGAIGGGLLGIPGGPAGIIAGASAGYGLGSQVGGAAYGALNNSPPPSFNPSYRGNGS